MAGPRACAFPPPSGVVGTPGMAVLQSHLPFVPWMDPRTARLPGIIPIDENDWLRTDDVYAGQMAERDRLIASNSTAVHAMLPQGVAAASELFDRVLDRLASMPGFHRKADDIIRPDGMRVALNRAEPLLTLGRLVQEDLCLLQSDGVEHVLTGAILCFPASWTLHQKIGRPLLAIHHPVPSYTGDMSRRVQRLFDVIRPGQPLCRYNALLYDDPTLFQPRLEGVPRPMPVHAPYLRSERQCLVRLKKTGAVLFSIHTHIIAAESLTPEQRAGLGHPSP